MADNEVKEVAKYVWGELEGDREGLHFVITGNLLNDEGKIDRDMIFQAGRSVESISQIKLVVGPLEDEKARRTFTCTYGEKGQPEEGKWVIKEDGQVDVLADRSTSKRPKTEEIDLGPDAKKLITAAVHIVYPKVGEGGSTRTNKGHAERVAACENAITSLKESIEAVTGKAGLEVVVKTLQAQLDSETAKLAKLNTPRKKKETTEGAGATDQPATIPAPSGPNSADIAREAAKAARATRQGAAA